MEVSLANIYEKSIDLICGTARCDQSHQGIDHQATPTFHGVTGHIKKKQRYMWSTYLLKNYNNDVFQDMLLYCKVPKLIMVYTIFIF